MKNGRIDPSATPKIVREKGSLVHFDGQGALGQYVGELAMREAIARAKQLGLAWVSVINSNHYGMAGHYTRMAADEGLVAFSTSDTNVVDLAPFGGCEAKVGNNPQSWAVPVASGVHMVLDQACGDSSGGKVKRYAYLDELLPAAWGLDEKGNPSNRPEDIVVAHSATPQNSATGLISDLLCGPLLGTVAAVFKNKSMHDGDNGTGHLFFAIDPEFFTSKKQFNKNVADALEQYKGARKAEGVDEIFYPGEMEMKTHQERMAQGVPVPDKLMNVLAKHFPSEMEILQSPPKSGAI